MAKSRSKFKRISTQDKHYIAGTIPRNGTNTNNVRELEQITTFGQPPPKPIGHAAMETWTRAVGIKKK